VNVTRRGFLTTALAATAGGLLVPEWMLVKGRSMVSLAGINIDTNCCALCEAGMAHFVQGIGLHPNCNYVEVNRDIELTTHIILPTNWT
jgi:hypothetical protein